MDLDEIVTLSARVVVAIVATVALRRRRDFLLTTALLWALVILDAGELAVREWMAPSRIRRLMRLIGWLGQGYLIGGAAARWWGSPARPRRYVNALGAAVVAGWLAAELLPKPIATRGIGVLYLAPIAYAAIWAYRGLRAKGIDLTPERVVAGVLLACDLSSLLIVWAAGATKFYAVATITTACVYGFLGWRIVRWTYAKS